MLTTCPNCLHVFDHGHGVSFSSCCASRPLLLSATLQLPATTAPTTCTLSVTATPCNPHMAGGGIILQQTDAKSGPQPSPSTPLSFVLPPPIPFPWSVNLHVPVVPPPPPPQSETDLVRLAGTLSALRASGWYYEGLSWQESADALQSTAPGTFLVRDSSDPRFLFSLSVQTERGPTSIRLHYVCGQFRLDAEPRLAPLMPLFDCVVKLVEYYIAATRDGRKGRKAPRDREQVWVDARGQLYSHILLTNPLYKRQQLPSLQHLARLAINRQMAVSGGSTTRLPLPLPIADYLREYPYTH